MKLMDVEGVGLLIYIENKTNRLYSGLGVQTNETNIS